MAVIAGVTAAIGIGSAVASADAQRSGAHAAERAAIAGTNQQYDFLNEGRSLVDEYTQPYRAAGTNAINAMQGMMGIGGQSYDIETDPGYQFRVDQGVSAMDASASSRGNLLSGGALKDMNEFGQNMASQEYMNIFQRLAQISNVGIQATGMMSNAAMGVATGSANAAGDLAYTTASGETAIGNANADMWSGIGSAITMGMSGIDWGSFGAGTNTQGRDSQYGTGGRPGRNT